MRRFLVHLLIIIFLGLKFTVSVKAQDNSDAICIEPVKQKYGSDDLVTGLYWVTKKFIKYHGYSQKLNSPICNTYEITKNQYPNTFNKFISKYQWATGVISLTTNEIIEFTKQDQIFTQEKTN